MENQKDKKLKNEIENVVVLWFIGFRVSQITRLLSRSVNLVTILWGI